MLCLQNCWVGIKQQSLTHWIPFFSPSNNREDFEHRQKLKQKDAQEYRSLIQRTTEETWKRHAYRLAHPAYADGRIWWFYRICCLAWHILYCFLVIVSWNYFLCRCMLFGVMSYNLAFIFDCPIICKTVNILTNQTIDLCTFLFLIPRDLVGSLLISRLKIWTLKWFHSR